MLDIAAFDAAFDRLLARPLRTNARLKTQTKNWQSYPNLPKPEHQFQQHSMCLTSVKCVKMQFSQFARRKGLL
jgi:hypothetical protein